MDNKISSFNANKMLQKRSNSNAKATKDTKTTKIDTKSKDTIGPSVALPEDGGAIKNPSNVREIKTQLGIKGMEKAGPMKAAQKLFELIKD